MTHITHEIQSWLGGELTHDREEYFQDHLERCPECSAAVREAREVWQLLEIVATDVPTSGASLWPGIQSRTTGAPAGPAWFFGTRKWVQASLATVTLAAGLVLGFLMPAGESHTSQENGMTTGETSLGVETLWLTESSWTGGFNDLASGWLVAGQEATTDGSAPLEVK